MSTPIVVILALLAATLGLAVFRRGWAIAGAAASRHNMRVDERRHTELVTAVRRILDRDE